MQFFRLIFAWNDPHVIVQTLVNTEVEKFNLFGRFQGERSYYTFRFLDLMNRGLLFNTKAIQTFLFTKLAKSNLKNNADYHFLYRSFIFQHRSKTCVVICSFHTPFTTQQSKQRQFRIVQSSMIRFDCQLGCFKVKLSFRKNNKRLSSLKT